MCYTECDFIKITTKTEFLNIDKLDKAYFWSYKMLITNLWNKTIQIVTKYIEIIDENGKKYNFSSKGILGDYVVLNPNEKIEYSSGIPLFTPSGIVNGKYLIYSEIGEELYVKIPSFSLDSPYSKKSFH